MSLDPGLPVGTLAPAITLPDTDGVPVPLAGFGGAPLVVTFFPWAFSSVCTAELCGLRDRLPELSANGAQHVAISCDARASLKVFAERDGYDFPLLSDHWPHGEGARAFGVFDDRLGAAMRATFVLDAERVIRWKTVSDLDDPRSLDDVLVALGRARPG